MNKRELFKKRQKYIIIFFLAISVVQTISAQKIEFYRHLVFRESPFSDIKGIHPIDKETSEKETHYRFVHDKENRLVEVSHRLGDFIINDNDNWDSFIWFGSKMTIEYQGNQEIRHFYNRVNQRIEAHGKMYKAVFDLNEAGERTAVRFYDKKDNPAENGWNIHRYQWTIEENGFVLEERFSLNDEPRSIRPDFPFFKARLEFGKDDMLDFIYHLDVNGNLINNTMKAAMDRIVYDNEGNFSRWMVFDKNKKPAEGNAPEFAIGEHLYDVRGNKVELRGYDVAGRPKSMPNGVARVLNTYDKFNNQIEVKILDINDQLLQHVKREYSSDGKRIEWMKFYDAKENLTLHPQAQFAAMKFEYKADGSLEKMMKFDANLKEILSNSGTIKSKSD